MVVGPGLVGLAKRCGPPERGRRRGSNGRGCQVRGVRGACLKAHRVSSTDKDAALLGRRRPSDGQRRYAGGPGGLP